ncbi:MAG: phosphate ABC transporter permease subunit PstC [Planctomycetes bacterium]|nr:phosphate ABC transporter permease subunit PstC [Planctomycetota bacterium]
MSRFRVDEGLLWSLRGVAFLAGTIVVFVVAFVGWEASAALRSVGLSRFVTDPSWYPSEGLYSVLPMLVGTVLVTAGAVLTATPLGIMAAIFCNHYAPAFVARPYRRMIELMSGIPSVVYGFWGLVTLVPLIAQVEPPGTSLLAGIMILTVMILPTVTLFADSSIGRVSEEYTRGAAALGLTRWATVCHVVLPAARPGIVAGVFLATARAIGETMAVLMVCGNVVKTPGSLFDPVRTLTANIALEMAYAMGDHRSALFVTGLVLFLLIVALVWGAELAGEGRARG